ncbi:MAG: DUF4296 domain-containing protein [Bacteroidota bacterium]
MKFTRFFTISIIFFLVFSCKEKLIEPPEDLIPQAEMTEILYDLTLINGLRSINANALDKYSIETMPYLYEKYGIDSLQFIKSDEYYASVPVIYQAMYSTIKERLEDGVKESDRLREQKTDSLRSKNQRVRDSLKKKASSTKSPDSVPSKK